MNSEKKKDLVKTGLIAAFFLAIGFVLLDILIGSAMSPTPPKL